MDPGGTQKEAREKGSLCSRLVKGGDCVGHSFFKELRGRPEEKCLLMNWGNRKLRGVGGLTVIVLTQVGHFDQALLLGMRII